MEQTYLTDINLKDELIVLKSIKPKGFLYKLNFFAAHKDFLMFDIIRKVSSTRQFQLLILWYEQEANETEKHIFFLELGKAEPCWSHGQIFPLFELFM